MYKKLTEEGAKKLTNHIVDYMHKEGIDRNFGDDEKMRIPANFCYYEYLEDNTLNSFDPAVWFRNGKKDEEYDLSVVEHDPKLVEELKALEYYDYLVLKKAIEETKIFDLEKVAIDYPGLEEGVIANSNHFNTTFGKVKVYSINKSKN